MGTQLSKMKTVSNNQCGCEGASELQMAASPASPASRTPSSNSPHEVFWTTLESPHSPILQTFPASRSASSPADDPDSPTNVSSRPPPSLPEFGLSRIAASTTINNEAKRAISEEADSQEGPKRYKVSQKEEEEEKQKGWSFHLAAIVADDLYWDQGGSFPFDMTSAPPTPPKFWLQSHTDYGPDYTPMSTESWNGQELPQMWHAFSLSWALMLLNLGSEAFTVWESAGEGCIAERVCREDPMR
ncbi:hypothetical protein HII31_02713 [Pseudocercospora fuligena]|uniref:Uncharacterized protein n=1 Tax=Pseudocercospora fuligena TaxID=685502 RepID=A0A8H6RTI2_9PEZI|nr:hypothetical protein HII31_02713 [Pseudocercospora fuligena]